MRLIDADAFLKNNDVLADLEFEHPKYQVTLKEIIDAEPTIDAVEVVHGHWIQTMDKDENGNAYYSCSVCGSGECHVPEVNVPYCWKCGAKMDEKIDS